MAQDNWLISVDLDTSGIINGIRNVRGQLDQLMRPQVGSFGGNYAVGSGSTVELPEVRTIGTGAPSQTGEMRQLMAAQGQTAAIIQSSITAATKTMNRQVQELNRFGEIYFDRLKQQIRGFRFLPPEQQAQIERAFNSAFTNKLLELGNVLNNIRIEDIGDAFNRRIEAEARNIAASNAVGSTGVLASGPVPAALPSTTVTAAQRAIEQSVQNQLASSKKLEAELLKRLSLESSIQRSQVALRDANLYAAEMIRRRANESTSQVLALSLGNGRQPTPLTAPQPLSQPQPALPTSARQLDRGSNPSLPQIIFVSAPSTAAAPIPAAPNQERQQPVFMVAGGGPVIGAPGAQQQRQEARQRPVLPELPPGLIQEENKLIKALARKTAALDNQSGVIESNAGRFRAAEEGLILALENKARAINQIPNVSLAPKGIEAGPSGTGVLGASPPSAFVPGDALASPLANAPRQPVSIPVQRTQTVPTPQDRIRFDSARGDAVIGPSGTVRRPLASADNRLIDTMMKDLLNQSRQMAVTWDNFAKTMQSETDRLAQQLARSREKIALDSSITSSGFPTNLPNAPSRLGSGRFSTAWGFTPSGASGEYVLRTPNPQPSPSGSRRITDLEDLYMKREVLRSVGNIGGMVTGNTNVERLLGVVGDANRSGLGGTPITNRLPGQPMISFNPMGKFDPRKQQPSMSPLQISEADFMDWLSVIMQISQRGFYSDGHFENTMYDPRGQSMGVLDYAFTRGAYSPTSPPSISNPTKIFQQNLEQAYFTSRGMLGTAKPNMPAGRRQLMDRQFAPALGPAAQRSEAFNTLIQSVRRPQILGDIFGIDTSTILPLAAPRAAQTRYLDLSDLGQGIIGDELYLPQERFAKTNTKPYQERAARLAPLIARSGLRRDSLVARELRPDWQRAEIANAIQNLSMYPASYGLSGYAFGPNERNDAGASMYGEGKDPTSFIRTLFDARSEGSKVAEISESFLMSKYRGQGYGSSMYLDAMRQLRSDYGTEYLFSDRTSLSVPANNLWRRFEDAGLAELVEPGRLYKPNRYDSAKFYDRRWVADLSMLESPDVRALDRRRREVVMGRDFAANEKFARTYSAKDPRQIAGMGRRRRSSDIEYFSYGLGFDFDSPDVDGSREFSRSYNAIDIRKNRLVGQLTAYDLNRKDGQQPLLDNLAVLPGYRGRGIAKNLGRVAVEGIFERTGKLPAYSTTLSADSAAALSKFAGVGIPQTWGSGTGDNMGFEGTGRPEDQFAQWLLGNESQVAVPLYKILTGQRTNAQLPSNLRDPDFEPLPQDDFFLNLMAQQMRAVEESRTRPVVYGTLEEAELAAEANARRLLSQQARPDFWSRSFHGHDWDDGFDWGQEDQEEELLQQARQYGFGFEINSFDPAEIPEAQFDRGYHGSRFPLVGTHIDPLRAPTKNFGISSDEHINYIWDNPRTRSISGRNYNEEDAWRWANYNSLAGRPRVYEVLAEGPVARDSNIPGDDPRDMWMDMPLGDPTVPMAARRAEVLDTIWIPPPTLESGPVQGTLPELNWNDFGAPNIANPSRYMFGLSGMDEQLASASPIAGRDIADQVRVQNLRIAWQEYLGEINAAKQGVPSDKVDILRVLAGLPFNPVTDDSRAAPVLRGQTSFDDLWSRTNNPDISYWATPRGKSGLVGPYGNTNSEQIYAAYSEALKRVIGTIQVDYPGEEVDDWAFAAGMASQFMPKVDTPDLGQMQLINQIWGAPKIDELAVGKEFRGQGIGANLIDLAAEDAMRAYGVIPEYSTFLSPDSAGLISSKTGIPHEQKWGAEPEGSGRSSNEYAERRLRRINEDRFYLPVEGRSGNWRRMQPTGFGAKVLKQRYGILPEPRLENVKQLDLFARTNDEWADYYPSERDTQAIIAEMLSVTPSPPMPRMPSPLPDSDFVLPEYVDDLYTTPTPPSPSPILPPQKSYYQDRFDRNVFLASEYPEYAFASGFHGSTHDLVGTHLDPSVGRERKNFGMSSDDHINYIWNNPYFAQLLEDGTRLPLPEGRAWDWAERGDVYDARYRPRVFRVRAEGPVGSDPNLGEYSVEHLMQMRGQPFGSNGPLTYGNTAAMAARRAEVLDTIWTPAPSVARIPVIPRDPYAYPDDALISQVMPVQGTLPEVIWNDFGAPNVGNPVVGLKGLSQFDKQFSVDLDDLGIRRIEEIERIQALRAEWADIRSKTDDATIQRVALQSAMRRSGATGSVPPFYEPQPKPVYRNRLNPWNGELVSEEVPAIEASVTAPPFRLQGQMSFDSLWSSNEESAAVADFFGTDDYWAKTKAPVTDRLAERIEIARQKRILLNAIGRTADGYRAPQQTSIGNGAFSEAFLNEAFSKAGRTTGEDEYVNYVTRESLGTGLSDLFTKREGFRALAGLRGTVTGNTRAERLIGVMPNGLPVTSYMEGGTVTGMSYSDEGQRALQTISSGDFLDYGSLIMQMAARGVSTDNHSSNTIFNPETRLLSPIDYVNGRYTNASRQPMASALSRVKTLSEIMGIEYRPEIDRLVRGNEVDALRQMNLPGLVDVWHTDKPLPLAPPKAAQTRFADLLMRGDPSQPHIDPYELIGSELYGDTLYNNDLWSRTSDGSDAERMLAERRRENTNARAAARRAARLQKNVEKSRLADIPEFDQEFRLDALEYMALQEPDFFQQNIDNAEDPDLWARTTTNPRAVLTMGFPASGKSTIIPQRYNLDEFSLIDPDINKQNYVGPALDPQSLHQWSVAEANRQVQEAIAAQRNVIVAKTGGDTGGFLNLLQQFKGGGFDTEVLNVRVPAEIARQRNAARDRQVPGWVIDDLEYTIPETERLIGPGGAYSNLVDNYQVVDNFAKTNTPVTDRLAERLEISRQKRALIDSVARGGYGMELGSGAYSTAYLNRTQTGAPYVTRETTNGASARDLIRKREGYRAIAGVKGTVTGNTSIERLLGLDAQGLPITSLVEGRTVQTWANSPQESGERNLMQEISTEDFLDYVSVATQIAARGFDVDNHTANTMYDRKTKTLGLVDYVNGRPAVKGNNFNSIQDVTEVALNNAMYTAKVMGIDKRPEIAALSTGLPGESREELMVRRLKALNLEGLSGNYASLTPVPLAPPRAAAGRFDSLMMSGNDSLATEMYPLNEQQSWITSASRRGLERAEARRNAQFDDLWSRTGVQTTSQGFPYIQEQIAVPGVPDFELTAVALEDFRKQLKGDGPFYTPVDIPASNAFVPPGVLPMGNAIPVPTLARVIKEMVFGESLDEGQDSRLDFESFGNRMQEWFTGVGSNQALSQVLSMAIDDEGYVEGSLPIKGFMTEDSAFPYVHEAQYIALQQDLANQGARGLQLARGGNGWGAPTQAIMDFNSWTRDTAIADQYSNDLYDERGKEGLVYRVVANVPAENALYADTGGAVASANTREMSRSGLLQGKEILAISQVDFRNLEEAVVSAIRPLAEAVRVTDIDYFARTTGDSGAASPSAQRQAVRSEMGNRIVGLFDSNAQTMADVGTGLDDVVRILTYVADEMPGQMAQRLGQYLAGAANPLGTVAVTERARSRQYNVDELNRMMETQYAMIQLIDPVKAAQGAGTGTLNEQMLMEEFVRMERVNAAARQSGRGGIERVHGWSSNDYAVAALNRENLQGMEGMYYAAHEVIGHPSLTDDKRQQVYSLTQRVSGNMGLGPEGQVLGLDDPSILSFNSKTGRFIQNFTDNMDELVASVVGWKIVWDAAQAGALTPAQNAQVIATGAAPTPFMEELFRTVTSVAPIDYTSLLQQIAAATEATNQSVQALMVVAAAGAGGRGGGGGIIPPVGAAAPSPGQPAGGGFPSLWGALVAGGQPNLLPPAMQQAVAGRGAALNNAVLAAQAVRAGARAPLGLPVGTVDPLQVQMAAAALSGAQRATQAVPLSPGARPGNYFDNLTAGKAERAASDRAVVDKVLRDAGATTPPITPPPSPSAAKQPSVSSTNRFLQTASASDLENALIQSGMAPGMAKATAARVVKNRSGVPGEPVKYVPEGRPLWERFDKNLPAPTTTPPRATPTPSPSVEQARASVESARLDAARQRAVNGRRLLRPESVPPITPPTARIPFNPPIPGTAVELSDPLGYAGRQAAQLGTAQENARRNRVRESLRDQAAQQTGTQPPPGGQTPPPGGSRTGGTKPPPDPADQARTREERRAAGARAAYDARVAKAQGALDKGWDLRGLSRNSKEALFRGYRPVEFGQPGSQIWQAAESGDWKAAEAARRTVRSGLSQDRLNAGSRQAAALEQSLLRDRMVAEATGQSLPSDYAARQRQASAIRSEAGLTNQDVGRGQYQNWETYQQAKASYAARDAAGRATPEGRAEARAIRAGQKYGYDDTPPPGYQAWQQQGSPPPPPGGGAGGRGGGRGGGGGFNGAGWDDMPDPDAPKKFWQGRQPGESRFAAMRRNVRTNPDALGFFGGGALSVARYGLPSMAMFGAFAGISTSLREAEEFRYNLSRLESQLEATFGDRAAGMIDGVKDNILNVAKNTGVAADELAAMEIKLRGAFEGKTIQGLSGEALINTQRDAAAKLTAVTKLPSKEVTDSGTAISLAFNRTLQNVGDITTNLEAQSGVSSTELFQFLGDVAPIAEDSGFSLEEIAALGTVTLQRSGRSGASLAEAYNRILPAMAERRTELTNLAGTTPALQTDTYMDALRSGDYATVLIEIAKNFKGLNAEAQKFVITLLGGRREAQALIPALSNPEGLGDLIKDAGNSDGALEDRFQKIRSTLTNSLQRLGEQFRQFTTELLDAGLADAFAAILATLSGIGSIISPIIGLVADFNTSLGGIPGKVLAIALAFAVMRAGVTKLGGMGLGGSLAGMFGGMAGGIGQRMSGPIMSRLAAQGVPVGAGAGQMTGQMALPMSGPGVGPAGGAGLMAGLRAAGPGGAMKALGGAALSGLLGILSNPLFLVIGVATAFEAIKSKIEQSRQKIAEIRDKENQLTADIVSEFNNPESDDFEEPRPLQSRQAELRVKAAAERRKENAGFNGFIMQGVRELFNITPTSKVYADEAQDIAFELADPGVAAQAGVLENYSGIQRRVLRRGSGLTVDEARDARRELQNLSTGKRGLFNTGIGANLNDRGSIYSGITAPIGGTFNPIVRAPINLLDKLGILRQELDSDAELNIDEDFANASPEARRYAEEIYKRAGIKTDEGETLDKRIFDAASSDTPLAKLGELIAGSELSTREREVATNLRNSLTKEAATEEEAAAILSDAGLGVTENEQLTMDLDKLAQARAAGAITLEQYVAQSKKVLEGRRRALYKGKEKGPKAEDIAALLTAEQQANQIVAAELERLVREELEFAQAAGIGPIGQSELTVSLYSDLLRDPTFVDPEARRKAALAVLSYSRQMYLDLASIVTDTTSAADIIATMESDPNIAEALATVASSSITSTAAYQQSAAAFQSQRSGQRSTWATGGEFIAPDDGKTIEKDGKEYRWNPDLYDGKGGWEEYVKSGRQGTPSKSGVTYTLEEGATRGIYEPETTPLDPGGFDPNVGPDAIFQGLVGDWAGSGFARQGITVGGRAVAPGSTTTENLAGGGRAVITVGADTTTGTRRVYDEGGNLVSTSTIGGAPEISDEKKEEIRKGYAEAVRQAQQLAEYVNGRWVPKDGVTNEQFKTAAGTIQFWKNLATQFGVDIPETGAAGGWADQNLDTLALPSQVSTELGIIAAGGGGNLPDMGEVQTQWEGAKAYNDYQISKTETDNAAALNAAKSAATGGTSTETAKIMFDAAAKNLTDARKAAELNPENADLQKAAQDAELAYYQTLDQYNSSKLRDAQAAADFAVASVKARGGSEVEQATEAFNQATKVLNDAVSSGEVKVGSPEWMALKQNQWDAEAQVRTSKRNEAVKSVDLAAAQDPQGRGQLRQAQYGRIRAQVLKDTAFSPEERIDAEIAIAEAETAIRDAQNARINSLARVYQVGVKDSLKASVIGVDLAKINADYAKQEYGSDSAEFYDALAALGEAEKAQRASYAARVQALFSLKKSRVNDNLYDANLDTQAAKQLLGEARRGGDIDEIIAAEEAYNDAVNNERQQYEARVRALFDLKSARTRDPMQQSDNTLSMLNQLMESAKKAGDLDAIIALETEMQNAQQRAADLMQDVRMSMMDLRRAELSAMEDEVGAAQVARQQAYEQLQYGIDTGQGEAVINRLRAQAITADKAAQDAVYGERYDEYRYMLEMNEISKSTYMDHIKNLQSTVIPGSKKFKEIELELKRMKDDMSSDLSINMPSTLGLPTIYEIRRMNQQTSYNAQGGATAYDNRTLNINGTTIANGMDFQQFVDALAQFMGVPGTSGDYPRR